MSIMSIPLVAYEYWVNKGCFDVINGSVNRASMILSLTHSAIKRLHCHILDALVGVIANKANSRLIAQFWKWGWTEGQRFWPCFLKNRKGCTATLTHNWTIGGLSSHKLSWQHPYYVLKMRVNRASTTFILTTQKIPGRCSDIIP